MTMLTLNRGKSRRLLPYFGDSKHRPRAHMNACAIQEDGSRVQSHERAAIRRRAREVKAQDVAAEALSAARNWAAINKIKVRPRGWIPADVLAKFEVAGN
jgi:hypothetical protein